MSGSDNNDNENDSSDKEKSDNESKSDKEDSENDNSDKNQSDEASNSDKEDSDSEEPNPDLGFVKTDDEIKKYIEDKEQEAEDTTSEGELRFKILISTKLPLIYLNVPSPY